MPCSTSDPSGLPRADPSGVPLRDSPALRTIRNGDGAWRAPHSKTHIYDSPSSLSVSLPSIAPRAAMALRSGSVFSRDARDDDWDSSGPSSSGEAPIDDPSDAGSGMETEATWMDRVDKSSASFHPEPRQTRREMLCRLSQTFSNFSQRGVFTPASHDRRDRFWRRVDLCSTQIRQRRHYCSAETALGDWPACSRNARLKLESVS